MCVLTNQQAAANSTLQVRIIAPASDNYSETTSPLYVGDFLASLLVMVV